MVTSCLAGFKESLPYGDGLWECREVDDMANIWRLAFASARDLGQWRDGTGIRGNLSSTGVRVTDLGYGSTIDTREREKEGRLGHGFGKGDRISNVDCGRNARSHTHTHTHLMSASSQRASGGDSVGYLGTRGGMVDADGETGT